MTAQSRAQLYQYFMTGDFPDQQQFQNLIDSSLNLAEVSAQIITSDVSALGKLDVTGNFVVKASASATFTGNVSISGALTVTGSANAALTGNLTVTGAGNFNGKNSIKGTTTNDAAATGYVGEFLVGISGSAFSLVDGVAIRVAVLPLQPGDYDVWGTMQYNGASNTTLQYVIGQINTTSGTIIASQNNYVNNFYNGATVYAILTPLTLPITPYRISVATSANYFLNLQSGFAVGANTGSGTIYARRLR